MKWQCRGCSYPYCDCKSKRFMVVVFLFLMLPSFAMASPKEYTYSWQTRGGLLKYKTSSNDPQVAYERAADFCFEHLLKKYPNADLETKVQEIIDVCVNPR